MVFVFFFCVLFFLVSDGGLNLGLRIVSYYKYSIIIRMYVVGVCGVSYHQSSIALCVACARDTGLPYTLTAAAAERREGRGRAQPHKGRAESFEIYERHLSWQYTQRRRSMSSCMYVLWLFCDRLVTSAVCTCTFLLLLHMH